MAQGSSRDKPISEGSDVALCSHRREERITNRTSSLLVCIRHSKQGYHTSSLVGEVTHESWVQCAAECPPERRRPIRSNNISAEPSRTSGGDNVHSTYSAITLIENSKCSAVLNGKFVSSIPLFLIMGGKMPSYSACCSKVWSIKGKPSYLFSHSTFLKVNQSELPKNSFSIFSHLSTTCLQISSLTK